MILKIRIITRFKIIVLWLNWNLLIMFAEEKKKRELSSIHRRTYLSSSNKFMK